MWPMPFLRDTKARVPEVRNQQIVPGCAPSTKLIDKYHACHLLEASKGAFNSLAEKPVNPRPTPGKQRTGL
jgi:hypothetical protein